ncbi:MAG: DNA-directed RNA polymerase subunit alpha C-terminal domain-containing protein [Planctomycetota bacterium]|nr:DNA-directed RNA polymerase subunit alpha C-terminal domain-containing protein [Planctomycetota bacterium]
MTTTAETSFDIKTSAIQSFAALQHARGEVYETRQTFDRFRSSISALATSGDEGRRRGFGYWMSGEYQKAIEALRLYPEDNVASFTMARAHMAQNEFKEALPIFERLSKVYPDEPRPRAGGLEARLELDLENGDEEGAISRLAHGIQHAPASFRESAEGRHMQGRLAEMQHDTESAVEHYSKARELDPTHRANLFRLAYCAERTAQDEVALEAYQMLVRMLPIDRNTLMNLGVLYEDMGRDQDAAACFDTIARSFPTDRKIRLFLEDAKSAMNMYYDEDMERKEDRLNQILRIPITDFELSVRARNCLNKMNIMTLGDLVRQTEQELLSYKNFGETSLNEIKDILASKGLRLGMAREEAVQSIEQNRRKYATGENSELLNKPISDLELSIRARRTVESLGCLTLGDVVQHSEEELLGMPNFGVTSLQELKGKLTDLGIKLKTKVP